MSLWPGRVARSRTARLIAVQSRHMAAIRNRAVQIIVSLPKPEGKKWEEKKNSDLTEPGFFASQTKSGEKCKIRLQETF